MAYRLHYPDVRQQIGNEACVLWLLNLHLAKKRKIL
jgi:hypothetical protein